MLFLPSEMRLSAVHGTRVRIQANHTYLPANAAACAHLRTGKFTFCDIFTT